MSAAQDEVDRLLNPKEKVSCHPEDRLTSDNDSNLSFSEEESLTYVHSDTEDDPSPNMISKASGYHIPTTIFEANTGPKGVIADAQSFERAKKRSFRRTFMNVAGLEHTYYSNSTKSEQDTQQANEASPPPDETEDERFMRQWREARMLELQRKSKRRVSPSKRRYGTVEVVNANGYLDAIEKVTPDTVVVVCIYDPESPESNIVEDCLATVARKQVTTRFVKLHYEIAEMEHVTPPALLAYRNGDVFATIMDIFHQLPSGRDCSSASLEDLLMQHRVF
ncbi:phosducin [Histoplasma ohiense]|nr:phosducin [Histoplasma ohiense (nom. inval.)]